MKKASEKSLKYSPILPLIPAPPSLRERIMQRIGLERIRIIARRRLAGYSAAIIISAAALIPAVRFAMEELSGSSFWKYLSLSWSDSAVVLASWKEFAFSLVESAPIAGIALTLSIVLLILFALRQTARSAAILKSPLGYAA